MAKVTAYSVSRIGSSERERLEDYSDSRLIDCTDSGGLKLQLGIVCDGVGSSDWGIRAARLTTEAIFEYVEENANRVQHVPDLLSEAIQAANLRVLDEIPSRQGNTTVALMAVDLTDERESPHGTLYIASVGDSPIYLIRDKQIMRLNTDHSVANEKLLDGEIEPDEVPYVENGHALTRAIGVTDDVEVDTGFYANGANRQTAFKRGQVGLKLQPHDTVFAASDGLVDQNPADGLPFVHDNEFTQHAMDRDVELSAKTLVSYAESRRPLDNVSISLIFVDGPKRRNSVRTGIPRGLLVLFALILVGAGMAGVVAVNNANQQGEQALSFVQQTATESRRIAEITETAARVEIAQLDAILITQTFVAGFTDTPTITPTPTNTPTPTATNTPPPTPTSRPTSSANGAGFMFSEGGASQIEVVRGEDIPPANGPRYVIADGGQSLPQPAALYMLPQTGLTIDDIDEQEIELLFPLGGDLFIESGQYAVGGITLVLEQDRNIEYASNASCIAAFYEDRDAPPDEITEINFSCYGRDGDCRVTVGNTEIEIPDGERIRVHVPDREQVGEAEDIDYSEALRYYEAITEMREDGYQPSCLMPIVDPDQDQLVAPEDECPFDFGTRRDNGCPPVTNTPQVSPTVRATSTEPPAVDTDGDGTPDETDRCPTVRVHDTYNDPCNSDEDNDGVPDTSDACPSEGDAGLGLYPSGCPILDNDGDGVHNREDNCPNQGSIGFGLYGDGCPILDGDNDGVPDPDDDCPQRGDEGFGVDGSGCPIPDTDGDGIPDPDDDCRQRGDEGFGVDENGCPIPDTDGDGIPDPNDSCPRRGDEGFGVDANGCPNPPPPTNTPSGGGSGSGNGNGNGNNGNGNGGNNTGSTGSLGLRGSGNYTVPTWNAPSIYHALSLIRNTR